jgi:hypothetical protein
MAIKFYTVATYAPSGFERLVQSADFYGIDLTVLGEGLEWVGFGQKVNLFKTELDKLEDDDVVGFVDGFDVVFLASEGEILEKFHGLNAKVVFGAEEACAPDASLVNRFPLEGGYDYRDHNYRFLNSGNFIGEVGELKKITEEEIADADSDQLYYQKKFLGGKPNVFGEVDGHEYLDAAESFDIVLDYVSDIFQCMKAAGSNVVDNVAYQCTPEGGLYWAIGKNGFYGVSDRWSFRDSSLTPCILHGHKQED